MKKTCSKCKIEKEITEFGRDGKRHRSECKRCRSEYAKRVYEANKEAILEDRKRFYIENKERIEKRKKKYRKENIEKVKAQERRSYYRHREANLARSRQYVEDNKANHLYKVDCPGGYYYIGSTTNGIKHRRRSHFAVGDHTTLSKHIKENSLSKEDLKYSVVKEFQDPEEMRIAERELIRKSYTDPFLLNEIIPLRNDSDMSKRFCTKCKIEKPVEGFHYLKSHNSYYSSCKQCKGAVGKEYREANKERVAKRRKEWYEANREKAAKYNKEYKEANKEKIAKRRKEHYEANKEKIVKRRKEYREANKEKLAKQRKEYRERKKLLDKQ